MCRETILKHWYKNAAGEHLRNMSIENPQLVKDQMKKLPSRERVHIPGTMKIMDSKVTSKR